MHAMDQNKVLEAIGRYRIFFEAQNIPKADYPHDKFLNDEWIKIVDRPMSDVALAHCHGMLNEMEEFVRQGRMEKVFRWLGFIQGCLWMANSYRLEDLKNHNRPNLTG